MTPVAVREAGPGRVLVVEDDESTALFVTTVLSRHGIDASWVTDAEQASERLEAEVFDVLLADYRLPGQDGMELARSTRLSWPAMGIAVMTSFAETHTVETARSHGVDDFFEKPLHSSNFVARIGNLVARARTHRSQAGSPSARGPAEAGPMESAPEVSPRSDTSGPPAIAGSGSGGCAATRDAAPQTGTAVAEGTAQPRHEGTDGGTRARFTAFAPPGELASSEGTLEVGCREAEDALSREEAGGEGRDLLARCAHPATRYLIEQALACRRVVEPVRMWASGTPTVSIASSAGSLVAPATRPGWTAIG